MLAVVDVAGPVEVVEVLVGASLCARRPRTSHCRRSKSAANWSPVKTTRPLAPDHFQLFDPAAELAEAVALRHFDLLDRAQAGRPPRSC